MSRKQNHGSNRWLAEKAIFAKQRKPKPGQEKWLHKKRRTINAKLRQAIIDILPLNTDKEEADRILHAIFDTILEGALRGERVVIPMMGHFDTITYRKHSYKTKQYYQKTKLRFTTSFWLRRFVRTEDEETDGTTGTGEGTQSNGL